jgi:nucleoside-diphosphate-sugar epimerase
MTRNLVVGSEGFVGKPLCAYLETAGEAVVRFDIKRNSNEDAREARLPLEGIDRVYFLAWDVGGAKYLYREDSQFRQLDWNLKLLLNVMPQLQESGIPFLFVSSQLAEEYDTVYGVTKRLGEIWTHLMKGVRVRLWNVYGPIEEPTERTHVVSDFVYQAVFNRKIEMMTTGEEQRHFIHIDDVCQAFHLAMSRNLQGVYDVSSFEWVKVKELAQIIADVTGAELIPGSKVGSTPVTPIRGKIPGWHAQISLEEGLRRLISAMAALRK